MTSKTIRNKIMRAKGKAGTWRALAAAWEMDVGQLHRTAMGLQSPSERVLRHLGVVKRVTYRPKKTADSALRTPTGREEVWPVFRDGRVQLVASPKFAAALQAKRGD